MKFVFEVKKPEVLNKATIDEQWLEFIKSKEGRSIALGRKIKEAYMKGYEQGVENAMG